MRFCYDETAIEVVEAVVLGGVGGHAAQVLGRCAFLRQYPERAAVAGPTVTEVTEGNGTALVAVFLATHALGNGLRFARRQRIVQLIAVKVEQRRREVIQPVFQTHVHAYVKQDCIATSFVDALREQLFEAGRPVAEPFVVAHGYRH